MKLLPRASLRWRILAWSFVPTTIILLAVALGMFYAYQRVTEDLVVGRNQQLARLSAGQLTADLANYSETLSTLARAADFYQNDPSRQSAALKQHASTLVVFDGGVLVLNQLGQVVATDESRSALLGQDWADRSFFRQMIHRAAATFSDILPGQPQVIAVAVPILDDQGEFRGTLAGMFRVGASGFSAFYGGIVKLRLGDNISLVDSSGRVIYHSNADLIGSDAHDQPAVQDVLKGQAGYLRTRDVANRDVLATYAPVPGTPWGLVSEEEWSSLLASGRAYEQFLLALLALGIVVPTLVVTIGVKRITDPLAQLNTAAKAIAGGNFGQEIQVDTGDELEELVKQFNHMSRELAQSYAALKEREERLALVVQATNDGVWDWNLQTNETYFSPRWKTMLGYEDQEIPNRFEEWRRLTYPDDLERALAELQGYLQGQKPVYELEHRLRHKDGSYRWVLARGVALYDSSGKAYRMVGSHTDVTERKHAEEAIRQSEKRFAQVFAASPIPITITTLGDGRYIEVNDAWLRLFGYTREQVLGRTSLELNIWVEPAQRLKMIQQLQVKGALRDFEHLARTSSGEVRDVLVSAEVIELYDGHYNLSIVFDISERKQAQQALERRVAERTHELATLNAIAEVISQSLDLKEIMNAAVLKAMEATKMEISTAYSVQEDEGPDQEKHLVPAAQYGLPPEFTAQVGLRRVRESGIRAAAETQKPVVWHIADYPEPAMREILGREGVRQIINTPLLAKGKFVGALNLATRKERVITPEELALLAAIGQEVGLAVENARLYDKAEQSAALAERTRLARELHDSVTQSLYSVTMYAEAAQLLLTSGNHQTAAEHLRELRDTAQEALGEMRLLIYELRPLALDKQGLAEALRERVESVEMRGGIKPDIYIEGAEHLPLAIQQELYHIAREGLNNIVKHAHAHCVRLRLMASETSACLEISDDGVGFDTSSSRGGLGVAGMRERVQRIGGKLDITSVVGKGTEIRVSLGSSGEPGGFRGN